MGKLERLFKPQLDWKTTITTKAKGNRYKDLEVQTLLDTGCTKSSIDIHFVRQNKIVTKEYAKAIPVRNADQSINSWVKEYVEVKLLFVDSENTEHRETIELQVLRLGGGHNIFLGWDWFELHSPLIDFRHKQVVLGCCDDPKCERIARTKKEDLGKYINRVGTQEDEGLSTEYIRAAGTKSTTLAAEAQTKKDFILPDAYKDYADIFEKKEFDTLPERRPWDHQIHLLPGAEQDRKLRGKVYPLGPKEDEALQEFLKENLKSGRILSLQIIDGGTILLRQQERRQTSTSPRLSQTQCGNGQRQLPTATDLGRHKPNQRRQVFQ